jgi:hypothetical protein
MSGMSGDKFADLKLLEDRDKKQAALVMADPKNDRYAQDCTGVGQVVSKQTVKCSAVGSNSSLSSANYGTIFSSMILCSDL